MNRLMRRTGTEKSPIGIAPVGRSVWLPVDVRPRLLRRQPNPNIH
jgi:hypothetical protein